MADISKITLPSGTTYDIKDAVARQAIAGGVSFIIAWDGSAAPVSADIPYGVVVNYNNTATTGSLACTSAQPGAFYFVKSSTTPSSETLDVYDEYVVVKPDSADNTTWFWQKIGDTKINLTDVVTNVTLNKSTDTVIGTDSTFTITQPTIALATDSSSGTGKVQVATGISSVTQPTIALSAESATATGRTNYIQSVSTTKIKAAASGGAVSASGDEVTALTGLGTPSTSTVLTGVKVTAQPTISLTANASTATGRITYVQAQGTATTTKLSASASGAAVSATGDNVTALTGLGTASTKSAIGASSTFTITQPTIALSSNGSTATGRVQVATGAGTTSTTNTDWLKSVSVSNETLTIGAATHNTTYLGASASGANTAWNNKDSVTAVTGYASPTTDTVIGTASTFNVTQPTVTIASGSTGDVSVATGIGAATTKYLSAAASGTAVGADGTASAVTGYASPETDTVLGSGSTFSVTNPTVTLSTGSTGDVTIATGGTTKYLQATASGAAVTPSTTYIKGTASGANTAWNSKDSVTVLTNNTSISVTKGS